MATIRTWQESVDKKSIEELQEIDKAISTLLKWDLFKLELYRTMGKIQLIVRNEHLYKSIRSMKG